MRIKNTKKKGFFNVLKKLEVWQKLAIITSGVVVVGGLTATVYALTSDNSDKDAVPAANSSDAILEVLSSQDTIVNESSSEINKEESSDLSSNESSNQDKKDKEDKEHSQDKNEKESPTTSPKKVSEKKDDTIDVSSKKESDVPPPEPVVLPEGYKEKYSKYYLANKDIAGWIKLAGTKLNYPVVQGKDNSYYLNHNEYKAHSCWGVPYMDYRITNEKDCQSTNTILYGHSDDKRGLQFSAIKGYRKIDFYKQHPTIEFDTVYSDGMYKVVALFIEDTKPGRKFYGYNNFINSSGEKEFNHFIENAKSKSYISTTVDVLPKDKLLTISTCEDTNVNNYNRLVLVARKVRPEEDTSVDTSGATQNAQQVLPK